MPALPPGEHDLQDLALNYAQAEGGILAHLAQAAEGDRAASTRWALGTLADLQRLDHRTPVVTAYLHEHPRGKPLAVKDIAGSLAQRLQRAAVVTADSVRHSFRAVTVDTIPDHVTATVTAYVDRQGSRWPIGAYALMLTQTLGRQSSTRGVSDRAGEGHTVIVNVGDCDFCAEFAGEAVIGTDPLPPYHPNCSCTVSHA